ncbi:hypothetical protein NUG22_19610 [Saccharothrix longispora]|nr:hypothetical protein [Saccharothrix longispora]
MPHVLEKVGDSTTPPSWFSVTGIGVQAAQRFRSGLLWRASWGASPGQVRGDRTA